MEPVYVLLIVKVDIYLLIPQSLVSPCRLAYCAYQNHSRDRLLFHNFFLQKGGY